ncbi:MAG: VOC family protein [Parasporobacterium sp.]|nr:VOC family protein [Parasporobacterium sp.]
MKLLHVTIQTDKFEEELDFYQNIVGLIIITDMRPLGRNMVFLADAKGDTEIEIIDNPEANDAGNQNLSIGFRTEDVQKKFEDLKAQGLEISPMIRPVPNVAFFFVKDPAGVTVQFM